jgi:hypothetical protein
MTDQERVDLESLGYVEGDAIPGELAEKLSAIRKVQATDFQQALKKVERDGKVLHVIPPIDIGSLPPAKQAELRTAMKQANADLEAFEQEKAARAAMAQLPPSVREAAKAAAAPVEVFRSKPVTKRLTDPAPPPPAENAAPPVETPTVAADQEDPQGFSDGSAALSRCQHCNWPLAIPEKAEPTTDEIIRFAMSILGGKPFQSTKTFFGTSMQVTYRSISRRDSDLIYKQISADRRAGRLLDEAEFWRYLWNYRLVVSLDSVIFDSDAYNVAAEVDERLNATSATDTETPLPELLEALASQPMFLNEVIWNILDSNNRRFQDLVLALEAKADDPSFWSAVGS